MNFSVCGEVVFKIVSAIVAKKNSLFNRKLTKSNLSGREAWVEYTCVVEFQLSLRCLKFQNIWYITQNITGIFQKYKTGFHKDIQHFPYYLPTVSMYRGDNRFQNKYYLYSLINHQKRSPVRYELTKNQRTVVSKARILAYKYYSLK